MGACCDLFERHQIYTNQSRLKILQTRIQVKFTTNNDKSFTYFLPFFELHNYLEKVLKQYRETTQLTGDGSAYQFEEGRIQQELKALQDYLRAVQSHESLISMRIQKDIQTIHKQLNNEQKPTFPCMIKLQIQDYELVLGITALKVKKMTRQGSKNQQFEEENIVAGRTKHQHIYRELVFPSDRGSVQILTVPIESAVTIDVQDVMRQEVVCNVLKFQAKDQDFGFIAVRMQFCTEDPSYNSQRREKLAVMEKEMKICLRKASRGSMSESISQHSHRDTYVSDHVSEYHNEYQA